MQTRSRRVTWWMNLGAALLGACLLGSPEARASVHLEPGPASATMADLLLAGVADLPALAALAGGEDPTLAASATRRLRAAGPTGLAAGAAWQSSRSCR